MEAAGGSDFNCDFNAPMFVDFTALDNENDHADAEAYFDTNHEMGGGGASSIPTEFEPSVPTTSTVDNVEEATKQVKKPKNIVTSWGGSWAGSGPSAPSGKGSTTSLASRQGASAEDPNNADTPTRRALRQAVKDTIREITNSPKLKIPEKGKVGKGSPVKRLNAGKPLPAPSALNSKKATPTGSAPVERKPPSAKAPSNHPLTKKPSMRSSPGINKFRKALQQMTPEIVKQARSKKIQKEAEAAAAAAAAEQKPATVAIKAQLTKAGSVTRPVFGGAGSTLTRPTAASTNRAAAALTAKPTASTATSGALAATASRPLAPTEPRPFNFATTARRNQQNTHANEPVKGSNDVDFSKMLRSYQQHSTNKGTPVCTEVQPFNLSAGQRSRSTSRDRGTPVSRSASHDRGRSPNLGNKGTPAARRFRSASPNPSPWRPTITQAKTPNLATRGRARGPDPNILSQTQREEAELRGRQPFKAQPPRIPAKPIGIPQVKAMQPVVPESPAFALKQRMETRKRQQDPLGEPEPKRIIYAKPAPSRAGVPVILPSISKKATQPKPFSFDSRDAATQERKEQRIQAQLEEERRLREFKAKPIPSSTNSGSGVGSLPEVPVREPTKPQPFDLEIERRVGDRLNNWKEAVEQDLKKQREAANFRAKPAAILEREPFRPKPSEKLPTALDEEFQLNSDRRAAERILFDEKVRKREAEETAEKRRVEQLREKEREEEVRQIRQEAVHKALPIKHYKPVTIVPSDRPLTDARSPNWTRKQKKSTDL